MTDEFAAVAQLPNPKPGIANVRTHDAVQGVQTVRQQFLDFVRHPENHKQAFRFLCVGGSGYVVNLVSFAVLLHAVGVQHTAAFWLASLIGTANNFWWNRSWTFDASHHHIGKQGIRFLLVSACIAGLAYLVYLGIVSTTGMDKVMAEGLAYIIVTPVSFLVQKLWSFKA